MGGNRNAGRVSRPLGRTFVFGRRSFQLFELKLHLVEELLRALGFAAVKLAFKLLDGELQMRDQCFGARNIGVRAGSFRLGACGLCFRVAQFGARGDHQRLQRFDTIG